MPLPPTTTRFNHHSEILLVVDDPTTARCDVNHFHLAGYHVNQVSQIVDIATGVALLKEIRPDAVVIEVTPVDLSGLDFVKLMRATPEFSDLPIILCAHALKRTALRKARTCGATVVLSGVDDTAAMIVTTVQGLIGRAHRADLIPPPDFSPAGLIPFPSVPPFSEESNQTTSNQLHSPRVTHSFLIRAPKDIAMLREGFSKLLKQRSSENRVPLPFLCKLRDQLHLVAGNIASVGLTNISRIARGLELILADLCRSPDKITDSTLRTIAEGFDFLSHQIHQNLHSSISPRTGGTVLVISKTASSREVAVHAVEGINLQCAQCADFKEATILVKNKHFDLCIVDLDPANEGISFCLDLRHQFNRKTPIILLVENIDFESRSKFLLSEATSILAKPFLSSELAMKVLLYVGCRTTGGPASVESISDHSTSIPGEGKNIPSKYDQSDVAACHVNIARDANAASPRETVHQATPMKSPTNGSFRIQRILVPIDLSQCSQKALLYAIEFALEYQSSLDILYVVPPSVGHEPYDFSASERIENERRRTGQEQLTRLLNGQIPKGVSTQSFVRNGRPATEIIEKAKERNTDLIIISTHGFQGISQSLSGGTTDNVVRRAPCPILVVREQEHEFLVFPEPDGISPTPNVDAPGKFQRCDSWDSTQRTA